jgi:uncharacterized protein YbaR (Trm112 family)
MRGEIFSPLIKKMAMICGQCKTQFDITTGIPRDEICPCCGEKLKLTEMRCITPFIIGNRQKPMGYKYHVQEMNADKDRWEYFRSAEERGNVGEGKNKVSKRDSNYWHKTLKEKGKKEGWL